MLDPARLEQLLEAARAEHLDWPAPPSQLRALGQLRDLGPQLARDHAALLRWAETVRVGLAAFDYRPIVGIRIEARRLLAALDDLRTRP